MDMGRLKRMAEEEYADMHQSEGMGNWSNTLHPKTKVQIVTDVGWPWHSCAYLATLR
jgi:hypothetical protein